MCRHAWKYCAIALALTTTAATVPVPAHTTVAPSAKVPTRPLPAPVRELAEQVAGQLLQVQEQAAELDCARAVVNARYGLDTMLEVGEKNVRDGYLPQTRFDATAAKLRAFRDGVSAQDCQAATGARQAFYRCMSSDHNHVMACAKQHES
ncbi:MULTISPECIES: hypothetical protein [Lysobacter]|uniref:Secreted protein n=1 Tax=Lysobacter firmicutimachus TaxID=1792846 RepID=A0ABU8D1K7_9GAMM|nr:hypothetical protein [Lysobacter antibioticus]